MLKYAKVTNEETGRVEIGTGTNSDFYKSIGMNLTDVQKSDIDGQWYLSEKCPMKSDEQKAQEEAERILELSMTRSDFFDGTIKAFGADESDLLTGISQVLTPMSIGDIEKKIALNNYQNALNFYRKHPLFTMLSDVPIPITEGVTITITSEQWDRFFDETNKRNPDAYKELLPVVEVPNED